MSAAYDAAQWTDLFVATAGAAAAVLAGVFGSIVSSAANAWVLLIEILR